MYPSGLSQPAPDMITISRGDYTKLQRAEYAANLKIGQWEKERQDEIIHIQHSSEKRELERLSDKMIYFVIGFVSSLVVTSIMLTIINVHQ